MITGIVNQIKVEGVIPGEREPSNIIVNYYQGKEEKTVGD